MDDPLSGPKLKIERANKQVREITDLILTFNRNDSYETFTEHDSANRRYFFKARCIKELPTMIGVIVGECLFNLRSALDQVFYAVSTRNGFELTERPGFAIEGSEKEFETKIHTRKIEQRLPKVAATLRELKPYKGGNILLWNLHMLNSLDKHRKIIPAGSAHFGQKFHVQAHVPKDGLQLHIPNAPQPLHEEAAILLGWDEGIELQGNVEFAVDIAFGDIETGQLQSVTDTLQKFCDLTAGIINIFDERFFNCTVL